MELLVFYFKNEVEMCEGCYHHMMKRGRRRERRTRNSHTDSLILLSSFDENNDIWKNEVMLISQRCFEGTREEMQLNTDSDFFHFVGTIFGIQNFGISLCLDLNLFPSSKKLK